MQAFYPSSTAIAAITFDPQVDMSMVYVSFTSDPASTYQYGPWPTAELMPGVRGAVSMGQIVSRMRNQYGSQAVSVESGSAGAMGTDRRVSPALNIPNAALAF